MRGRPSKRKAKPFGRERIAVQCVETGEVFDSMVQAANANSVHSAKISECVAGRRANVNGLRFKRVGDPDPVEVVKEPKPSKEPKAPRPARPMEYMHFPEAPPVGFRFKLGDGSIYQYVGESHFVRLDGRVTTLLAWAFKNAETGEIGTVRTTQYVKVAWLRSQMGNKAPEFRVMEEIDFDAAPWLAESGEAKGCTLQPRYLG